MKKYYKFIFMALFGLFIFIPKDTFAYDRIELSSQNGTVLWSANNTEVQRANVSDVKYIIFYFDLPLTSDTLYTLNNDFAYSVAGTTGNGVELIYLLLNGAENAFEHSWTTILQQDYDNFYHHIYVNHIKFYSYLSGTVQVQLTYVLSNTAFIGDVGIRDKSLVYDGSASEDTNDAINSGVTNIINNNNQNTDKIIDSNKEIQKEQEKTNEELGELNDNITSEEAPNLDALEDSAGWLPPGPVDSILNLPLTFFNNLISNLSKTCQPVQIPLPYVAQNLTLPCISSLYEQIGATSFLNWVGLVVGTILLYNYFLNLYAWIDKTIQMEDQGVDDWGGV